MDRYQRLERQAAVVRRQAEAGAAETATAHPLLRLQQQVGNSHIARLLAQRKSDDDQQNEFDAAAQTDALETVGQTSTQNAASPDITSAPQASAGENEVSAETVTPVEEPKPAAKTEEKDKQIAALRLQRESLEEDELQALHLQRQSEPEVGLEGGPVSEQFANRLSAQRGGGTPLASDTRQTMEGAFGTSFGEVRVHNGSQAAALSRSISAKAFTTGNDIFLGEGASTSDPQLMAHELTHVVQQRGLTGSGGGPQVSPAGDTHEHEAEAVAATVTSGGQLAGAAAQRRLARQE